MQFKNCCVWVHGMAQQIKELATKPGDLSSLPWPHLVEREDQLLQVLSDLRTVTIVT